MGDNDKKASEAGQSFKIGDVILERYQVLKTLGEGGFAWVYLCQDQTIDRRVAIKVLKPLPPLPEEDDEQTEARQQAHEERFRREANVASKLDNAHVVTVHDFGFLESPRRAFIVMEYIEGHDLRQELQRLGRMSPNMFFHLLIPCLRALGEAHKHGIVHKDLKPSNLILSGGRLRIVDFGVARVVGQQNLTAAGELSGTLPYLAPEYLVNKEVTPAVDVYQMGLIMAEMLTGQPVVTARTLLEALRLYNAGDLDPPHVLRGSPLTPVLEKALRHDPKARYADAGELANALAEINPDDVQASLAAQGIISNRTDPFIPTISRAMLSMDEEEVEEILSSEGALRDEASREDDGPSLDEVQKAQDALESSQQPRPVAEEPPTEIMKQTEEVKKAATSAEPPTARMEMPTLADDDVPAEATRRNPAMIIAGLVVAALIGGIIVAVVMTGGLSFLGMKVSNDEKFLFTDSPSIPVGDSPVDGNLSACWGFVVVFCDQTSESCAQEATVLKQLRNASDESVCVIYKDFFESDDKVATRVARAAHAAELQGAHTAYRERLLLNRDKTDSKSLIAHAKELGLDEAQFKRDRKSDKVKKQVKDDLELAKRLKVTSAPTIFVNGVRIDGVQPYKVLEAKVMGETKDALSSGEDYMERVKRNFKP